MVGLAYTERNISVNERLRPISGQCMVRPGRTPLNERSDNFGNRRPYRHDLPGLNRKRARSIAIARIGADDSWKPAKTPKNRVPARTVPSKGPARALRGIGFPIPIHACRAPRNQQDAIRSPARRDAPGRTSLAAATAPRRKNAVR